MTDFFKTKVLEWTTGAAFTLTMAQMVAPRFMDWILDFIVVGLVYVAAKLSQTKK
ncbi:MAG: hypothetical protein AAF357_15780 [Verrucomicrobiota bacterium]